MRTHLVEVTQNRESGFNWGKFLLGRFDDNEWDHPSDMLGPYAASLIGSQGWGREHMLVLDLATGEGAIFRPGGVARADLDKHKVWVCPMFEPFLEHMYAWIRDGRDAFDLPDVVELPDAQPEMQGYRRQGFERNECRRCHKSIHLVVGLRSEFWVHDSDGSRGCRAATFTKDTGWDDTIPRRWTAAPVVD